MYVFFVFRGKLNQVFRNEDSLVLYLMLYITPIIPNGTVSSRSRRVESVADDSKTETPQTYQGQRKHKMIRVNGVNICAASLRRKV